MLELIRDSGQYLKRVLLVRRNSKKIIRLESQYNANMIQLGKKFQELGLSQEQTNQYLEEINEVDNSIKEIDDKINQFTIEINDQEQSKQHKKKDYDETKNNLGKNHKEVEAAYKLTQKKAKEIANIISNLEKEIKNFEQKKIDNQKIIGNIQEGITTPVDASDDVESLEAGIKTYDDKISEYQVQISTEQSKLNQLNEESIPLQNEKDDLYNQLQNLKNDWDDKERQFNQKIRDVQLLISQQQIQKKNLDARKIIPYREIGKTVMDSPVENEELKSIYDNMHNQRKEIEDIKRDTVHNQEILRSSESQKIRNSVLIFLGSFLVILILIILLSSIGGNGQSQQTPNPSEQKDMNESKSSFSLIYRDIQHS